MVQTVDKGNHYSSDYIGKFLKSFTYLGKTEVAGEIMFHENCFDSEIVTQVNKAIGISFGLNGPHKNSVRIGFDTNGMAYAYYYQDGVGPSYITLGRVKAGVRYHFKVSDAGVWITGVGSYQFDRHIKTSFFAFPCFLYIGGNETAKRTMSIEVYPS